MSNWLQNGLIQTKLAKKYVYFIQRLVGGTYRLAFSHSYMYYFPGEGGEGGQYSILDGSVITNWITKSLSYRSIFLFPLKKH